MKTKQLFPLWLSLGALALTGCGGTGTVTLTTWGEEFIEQGIPATMFEDGVSVQFTRFVVVISDFTLATKTGTTGPKQKTPTMIDLTKPGPTTLETFSDTPALKWDEVGFAIVPAPADVVALGGISDADREAMKRLQQSVWVEGHLRKGTTDKTFSWAFTTHTAFEHCTNPDLGEGVTLPVGATETVELTIHGDHLWYDDLQSPEAKLRGTAFLEADANQDNVITQAELEAVSLTTLPLGQYGTGGASNVKSLNDFVSALTRTVGHFRGEGECEASAR